MTNQEIDSLPAGPEMDRLVAEKVMGWKIGWGPVVGKYWKDTPWLVHTKRQAGWSPSTDLNHAMEAVGDARHLAISREFHRVDWTVIIYPSMETEPIITNAPTPALAICRALLKAVNEEVSE